MIACPSIVLVALLQQPPAPPPSQSSPPAATAETKYEFPTKLVSGESRLIEIRTAYNSSFKFEGAGQATNSKERTTSAMWIVDTQLDPATQPKDHVWSGRRRFVKAVATKDGVVDDPEVNGFEANVWVDTAKLAHYESTTERLLTQSTLEELLRAAEAFGLGPGVALPRTAAVGDEFELPFAALAPWCLTTENKTPKANARLRFDSVDSEKNVARFKGPLHVEEDVEKSAEQIDAPFGIKGTGTYDGFVSIEYDIAAHRITRIVCRAKAQFQGETVGAVAAKASSTSVIETTITCSTGAPAAAALDEKPQFRDVPHEIANAGASIALPSHFQKVTIELPNYTAFRSLLHGVKGVVIVLTYPFLMPGKSLKEAGDQARKNLEETAGAMVTDATVSGGPATANVCEHTLNGVRSLDAVIQLEPGRFVLVQCSCPDAAFAERSKEFPKYFQSLKKLPAAK